MILEEFNNIANSYGFYSNDYNIEPWLTYTNKNFSAIITCSTSGEVENDYTKDIVEQVSIENIFSKNKDEDNITLTLYGNDKKYPRPNSIKYFNRCLFLITHKLYLCYSYNKKVKELIKIIKYRFDDLLTRHRFQIDAVYELSNSNNAYPEYTIFYKDDVLYSGDSVVFSYDIISDKFYLEYQKHTSEFLDYRVELDEVDNDKFYKFLTECYETSIKEDSAKIPLTSKKFMDIVNSRAFENIDNLEEIILGMTIKHKIYDLTEYYNASYGYLLYECSDNKTVKLSGMLWHSDTKELHYKVEII